MKSTRQLREQIAELDAEVEAIVSQATAQNRDLNAAETKRINEIQGDGESEGLLAELQEQLTAATQVENFRKQRAAAKMGHLVGASSNRGGSRHANSHGKEVIVLNRGDCYAAQCKPTETPHALGELVRAAVCGVSDYTPGEIRAVMTERNNSRGGWIVPTELASQVIDNARAKSRVMMAGARLVIMNSADLTMPKLIGDPTYTLHSELATIPLSDLTFGAVNLVSKTVAARIQASRELAEDSPLFPSVVEAAIGASFATQLDYFSLAGNADDGSEINGLLNTGAIAETTSVGAIDWLDLSQAATAIRVRNEEPSAAILHPSIHGAVMDLETGDGSSAARGWLGKPPSLQNVEVFDSTNCTSTKAIVGDFSMLAWGLRQGVLIEATTSGGD